jgi:tetratricopeptide (TPR) repeat protein
MPSPTITLFSSARSLAFVLLVGLASPTVASNGAGSPLELLASAKEQLAEAERTNDLRAEHGALRLKVQAEKACGLQADVLRTSLRALDLARSLGDPRAMAMDLRDLSMTYRVSGQLDKAIVEARNALALALPLQDDVLIHEHRLFLMDTEMQAEQYTEALRVGEEAMKEAEARGDVQAQGWIWLQVARVMLAQHKYSDALPFLTKATRVLGADGSLDQRFMLAVDQTKAMIGIGRIDQAQLHVKQVIELAGQLGSFTSSKIALHLQYECALGKGSSGEALAFLQQLKALDDSLHQAQVAQSIAALQVLHEVDVREIANEELREANAVKEATLAEVRSGNHVLLVLVAVLVVLAIALVFTSRYSLRMVRRMKLKNEVIREQHDQIHAKNLELVRQNMRLSETLVSEEEKEVMIREIHHRIKNNLQIVDSLLGIQMGHHGDPQLERQFREDHLPGHRFAQRATTRSPGETVPEHPGRLRGA